MCRSIAPGWETVSEGAEEGADDEDNSGGDVAKLAAVVHRTRHLPDFQVLAGSASFLLPAYVAGKAGAALRQL